LLHYCRKTGKTEHRLFSQVPELLRPGDLLLLNDSRVIPARFLLRKPGGGLVEGLFVSESTAGEWICMLKNAPKPGVLMQFVADDAFSGVIAGREPDGLFRLRIAPPAAAAGLLEQIGRMPLPPYLKRNREQDPRDSLDRERYQTVYARTGSSVAAPTAGLHFTPELLRQLETGGVEIARVTLDVGMGTFKPVTAPTLQQHLMHEEVYTISDEAAEQINRACRDGRRIVCVGTTSARVLESQPAEGPVKPGRRATRLLIYPPFEWKRMGALFTNFHLPRSTLVALVAAWVGLDAQRRIYRQAIERNYRFFSYGDASFLE
jgi:S-adenosylmethionine:tRNA ribosyltransferase-isomerase